MLRYRFLSIHGNGCPMDIRPGLASFLMIKKNFQFDFYLLYLWFLKGRFCVMGRWCDSWDDGVTCPHLFAVKWKPKPGLQTRPVRHITFEQCTGRQSDKPMKMLPLSVAGRGGHEGSKVLITFLHTSPATTRAKVICSWRKMDLSVSPRCTTDRLQWWDFHALRGLIPSTPPCPHG
jgi:hypothetical protein